MNSATISPTFGKFDICPTPEESSRYIPTAQEIAESFLNAIFPEFAPNRRDFVIFNDKSEVLAEVSLSEENSFFYDVPMFENGVWKTHAERNGHLCADAKLVRKFVILT